MASKSSLIEKRIENIEKEFSIFKKMFFSFLTSRKTFPRSDQQIWREIRDSYEKIQEKLFKERYPSLYAKIKK